MDPAGRAETQMLDAQTYATMVQDSPKAEVGHACELTGTKTSPLHNVGRAASRYCSLARPLAANSSRN
jgi:hypothetical protein